MTEGMKAKMKDGKKEWVEGLKEGEVEGWKEGVSGRMERRVRDGAKRNKKERR